MATTKKDPAKISDDELRPWVTNHEQDAQIDEKISELNDMLSITAPQKKAGARGESVLDRMPDSMIEFAEMAENEEWLNGADSDEEGDEDGYDFEYHEGYREGYPESQPLDEDPDVLALTNQLNDLNDEYEESDKEKTMLRPITKKEHEYLKQRMITLARHRGVKKKNIRKAVYMPSLHSRMYKEWTETRAATRASTAKFWSRDEEVFERPSTAFITSFLESQGVLPAQANILLPLDRPSTSSGRISTARIDTTFDGKTSSDFDILTLDDERLKSPNRPLAPILEGPGPMSPIAYNSRATRPFTDPSRSGVPPSPIGNAPNREVSPSCPFQDTSQLPLRPSTSASRPSTSQSQTATVRPSTSSSRNLKSRGGCPYSSDPPPVVFPSSNTDTIPSSNSSIVKFKTSRDQMIDTLNLPSKDQRIKAHKRAAERSRAARILAESSGSVSSRASEQALHTTKTTERFENTGAPLALSRLGITSTAGTVGKTKNIYQKHRLREMKSLQDQMRTSTGSFHIHASTEGPLKDIMDPHAAMKKSRQLASQVKATNTEDHTKDLVKLHGFFETVGPDKIYMSETHKFYQTDQKHQHALENRASAHATKPDHVREWANHAISDGRKLFCNNGGGFKI